MKATSKLKALRERNKGSRWVTPVRNLPAALEKRLAALGPATLSRIVPHPKMQSNGVLQTNTQPSMWPSSYNTATASQDFMWSLLDLWKPVAKDTVTHHHLVERGRIAQRYIEWIEHKKAASPLTELKARSSECSAEDQRCVLRIKSDRPLQVRGGQYPSTCLTSDNSIAIYLPSSRHYITMSELRRYWRIWDSNTTDEEVCDWVLHNSDGPFCRDRPRCRLITEVDARLEMCHHPAIYLNVLVSKIPLWRLAPTAAKRTRSDNWYVQVLTLFVSPLALADRVDCAICVKIDWPLTEGYGLDLPKGYNLIASLP